MAHTHLVQINSHKFEGGGGIPIKGESLAIFHLSHLTLSGIVNVQCSHSQDGTCPSCLGKSECMGDKGITCMRHSKIIFRHNICDAIFKVARSTNLAPRKE